MYRSVSFSPTMYRNDNAKYHIRKKFINLVFQDFRLEIMSIFCVLDYIYIITFS